jgi:uncharacterized protein (DUF983 family)
VIVGFTPPLVALALFLATIFDVPLRRALWIVAVLVLPALIVGALHLLENRDAAAWLPRELS